MGCFLKSTVGETSGKICTKKARAPWKFCHLAIVLMKYWIFKEESFPTLLSSENTFFFFFSFFLNKSNFFLVFTLRWRGGFYGKVLYWESYSNLLCPMSFKTVCKFKPYLCQSSRKATVIFVISSVRLALQPNHKYTLSQTHKHLEVLPLTMFWKTICVSNSTPESLVFTKGWHNKLYNEAKRGEMVEGWILHTAFLKWSKPLDTLVWSFIF